MNLSDLFEARNTRKLQNYFDDFFLQEVLGVGRRWWETFSAGAPYQVK